MKKYLLIKHDGNGQIKKELIEIITQEELDTIWNNEQREDNVICWMEVDLMKEFLKENHE